MSPEAQAFNIADASDALAGLAGISGLLWLLAFLYAILCFLIPFWIHSIMDYTKANYKTLKRIEELLERSAPPKVEPPAEPEFGTERPTMKLAAKDKIHQ